MPPSPAVQRELFVPPRGNAQILAGDCRDLLPTLADASIDAVITDPPYPEIDRAYGRLTELEWHELMREVVRETRRVLKPTAPRSSSCNRTPSM